MKFELRAHSFIKYIRKLVRQCRANLNCQILENVRQCRMNSLQIPMS